MHINDDSIEALEHDIWEDSGFSSYVVQTSQTARKKPVSQLSNEEIRLLIGQKTGLKYLLPVAISILRENPLIEVTFFEGDLLLQLLRLSEADWAQNAEDLKQFQTILRAHQALIRACDEIPDRLIEEYLQEVI